MKSPPFGVARRYQKRLVFSTQCGDYIGRKSVVAQIPWQKPLRPLIVLQGSLGHGRQG